MAITPPSLSPGATSDQVARLTAWDAQAGDGFGSSIAADQNVALIGAPAIGQTPSQGSAYVYDLMTGETRFTLLASDAAVADRFGTSVAIHSNTAIVGALFGGSNNSTLAGAAYLFDMETGQEIRKLNASDSEALDGFGASVAIHNNTALVGASTDNHTAGVDAGSAYLYDTATGQELAKLIADDAVAHARFGASVALNNHFAAIGAPHDSESADEAGAVYLFNMATGLQAHKLIPDDASPGDHFGISVALGDGLTIAGAPNSGDLSGPGAAYVFDSITGEQRFKLVASDATVGDHFGISVAIEQDIAIIGATLGAADESSLAGAAYVFDLTTGEQLAKLNAPDTQAIDHFGGAVTLMNNTAAIGARGRNTADGVDAGTAYLFDLSPPAPADLDGDGFIGISDLNLIFANWNLYTPIANPLADPTGDGYVGFDDLNLVLNNWNTGSPPASANINPEPASATILLLTSTALLRSRRLA